MIKRFGLSALLLSTVFAAAPALADDLTIGTPEPNYGNCYPFGCGASDGATTYQEIYNASAFSGPIRINAATFTEAFTNDGNAIDSASYDVSFYLSDKTTATLSNSISGNETSLLADWGTFTLGGTLTGGALTLSGPSFVYDPTQGSLLMNVVIHDVTNTVGYQTFFLDDAGTTSVARVFGDDQNTYGPYNQALVTTFDTSGVPEPASWAMMVGGFGLVGGAMRRRAAKVAFA
jgi:hypothetical protein